MTRLNQDGAELATFSTPQRSYIRTFTGRKFFWNHVEHNRFYVEDIAHALAYNCRFTGHTKKFYSVAQHSVYASLMARPIHALAALLHDAPEAYVHDTPSPLKWWLKQNGFTAFDELEHKIGSAVNAEFGLPYPNPPEIKEIDRRMLATEGRDLMTGNEDYSKYAEPYNFTIEPVSPDEAEGVFMMRFNDLVQENLIVRGRL